jgi:Glucodextranase, domain B/PASTA domain
MRRSLPPALALLAFVPMACGGDDAPPKNEPQVALAITSPTDAGTMRSGVATVTGTVKPARAHVSVLGKDVDVSGGTFSADVDLEPGANLIDVAASANGRRPDFAALRVIYEQRVRLPDVTGGDADSAKEQLEGLGLKVDSKDDGGFFDSILPGNPKVCEMQPRAGEQVLPGTQVTLLVARDC